MEEEAHVPPFTEMVVQGHITGKKLKDGVKIFVEPVGDDNAMYNIPYTVLIQYAQ